jgi:hypothetical protein
VATKDKGRPPKTPKTAAKKRARASKPDNKTDGQPDDAAAARRVALMRNKLTAAMEDPLTRSQIVAAIRSMMKNNG